MLTSLVGRDAPGNDASPRRIGVAIELGTT
jgi:hypothetical protein